MGQQPIDGAKLQIYRMSCWQQAKQVGDEEVVWKQFAVETVRKLRQNIVGTEYSKNRKQ